VHAARRAAGPAAAVALMALALLLLAAVLLLLDAVPGTSSAGQQQCATVFVEAQRGNDAHDGCSRVSALRTLGAAQARARHHHQATGGSPATVRLQGSFTVDRPLTLTGADSGSSWLGLWDNSGSAATVSGGVSIPHSAWRPAPDAGALLPLAPNTQLLQLNLSAALPGITREQVGQLSRHGYMFGAQSPPMQLHGSIGNRALQRVRWPKVGAPTLSMSVVRNPNKSAPIFDINSTRPQLWRKHSWAPASEGGGGGVWIDGILSQNWVWTFNRAINLGNGSFSLAAAEAVSPTTSITYCCHNRFFFYNVYDELSEVGEYYVDEAALQVYLVAPKAAAGLEIAVSASLLNSPLLILAPGASNISLRHLNLTLGRAAAVDAHAAARDITIDSVEISRFGLAGIELGPNSTVSNGRIHDVGTTGVNLYKSGDPATLTPGNSTVTNCHIHDWAQWSRVYTPAIDVGGVANTVTHCKIEGGPHAGILLYGNDHVISHCEISSSSTEFNDMGAIYMNLGPKPFHRGSVIHTNFFHHIGEGRPIIHGVYADDGSMGLTVHSNVFYKVNCGETCHATHSNGGAYINVTNNAFVDCGGPFEQADGMMLSSHYEQLVPEWTAAFAAANASGMLPRLVAHYPELANFWTENRRTPMTNTFSNNLAYNPSVPRGSGYDYVGRNFSARGFACQSCAMADIASEHVWLARTDPGFASVARMNFSLPASRVQAHIPGWREIDFATIGLLPGGPR
jgi:hypothetical protein